MLQVRVLDFIKSFWFVSDPPTLIDVAMWSATVRLKCPHKKSKNQSTNIACRHCRSKIQLLCHRHEQPDAGRDGGERSSKRVIDERGCRDRMRPRTRTVDTLGRWRFERVTLGVEHV